MAEVNKFLASMFSNHEQQIKGWMVKRSSGEAVTSGKSGSGPVAKLAHTKLTPYPPPFWACRDPKEPNELVPAELIHFPREQNGRIYAFPHGRPAA